MDFSLLTAGLVLCLVWTSRCLLQDWFYVLCGLLAAYCRTGFMFSVDFSLLTAGLVLCLVWTSRCLLQDWFYVLCGLLAAYCRTGFMFCVDFSLLTAGLVLCFGFSESCLAFLSPCWRRKSWLIWFVACVLYIVVCFFFLLVSLVGFDL